MKNKSNFKLILFLAIFVTVLYPVAVVVIQVGNGGFEPSQADQKTADRELQLSTVLLAVLWLVVGVLNAARHPKPRQAKSTADEWGPALRAWRGKAPKTHRRKTTRKH